MAEVGGVEGLADRGGTGGGGSGLFMVEDVGNVTGTQVQVDGIWSMFFPFFSNAS